MVPRGMVIMPSFIKMFPRWLCKLVSLGVVTMFSHSFAECSLGHSNVFKTRVVWTVWLWTFPIIDAVFTIIAHRLNNFMPVASDLAHHLTAVWKGNGADMARFATLFPPRGTSMSPYLDPLKPLNWLKFWSTQNSSLIRGLPQRWVREHNMQYMDMSQYDMIHTSCIMSSVTIMLLNNECDAANAKAEKEAKLLCLFV
jgi:hypothetical protein